MKMFSYLVKVAWQGLTNRLGYSASVITTMSFTLGTLFCASSLFYFLVLQPLPYADQERLFKVEKVQIDKSGEPNVKAYGYASLIHLYEKQNVFSSAGIAHYDDNVIVSHPTQPLVGTAFVTPDFHQTLGAKAHLGRLFDESEELGAYNPSAILSFGTWKDLYSSDQNVVGKTVELSGKSYKIVGVMSKAFVEPELHEIGKKTGLWLPWDFNPTPERNRTRWGDRTNPRVFIGKLDSEFSLDQAQEIVTTMVDATFKEKVANIPFYNGWSVKMELNSFRDVILGDSRVTAYLLMACAISLLLIAAANISNLFLSRAFERKKEFAIAAALGANLKQIRQGILAEILLLLSIATIVGLVLGAFGTHLVKVYLYDLLPINNLSGLNLWVVIAVLPIVAMLAWLFSLVSANVIDYGQLQASLMSSGKGTKAQIPQSVRNGLAFVQALFVTLLIFVNLAFSTSAFKVINDEEAIQTENLVGLSVTLDNPQALSRQESGALLEQVEAELNTLPQVEAVSRSLSPITSVFNTWSLVDEASLKTVLPEAKIVDEMYFELIGQPLLYGTMFSKAQAKTFDRVLIINDVLANRLYPNGDAVGNRLSFDLSSEQATFTVNGVVKGLKRPGVATIPPRVYRVSKGGADFIISIAKGQKLTLSTVKNLLERISKRLVVYEFSDLNGQKFDKLKTQYITGVLSVLLTIISVALASIGLYGIISYGIQLRRAEVGIRVSLGASRKAVTLQVINESMVAILVGVAVGFAVIIGFSEAFNEHVLAVIENYWFALGMFTLLCILIISFTSIIKPLSTFFKFQPIALLRDSER